MILAPQTPVNVHLHQTGVIKGGFRIPVNIYDALYPFCHYCYKIPILGKGSEFGTNNTA